ncbi:uncharacterized protein ARMOST_01186 [Armillaria ostoyae]|uniref:Protein kinase domain-containing protein n=1 Tax=Armillaria ostoyae TaxID=47428 RepID=A0A284QNC7_ARMOS|nr:uncharacterized protein ARMOST_01186 [Armillaria ostoyae]
MGMESGSDELQLNTSSVRNLTGQVFKLSDHPIGGGGFGDIWKGAYGDQWVAIKTVRIYATGVAEAHKLVRKEIKAWAKLDHCNVLPMLGICDDFRNIPSLISPWMDQGTANQYMKTHTDIKLIPVLSGIASGLQYLHRNNVVHGDLKGDNVLMSSTGIPRLADFGLSRVLVSSGLMSTSTSVKGSWRWMARELHDYTIEKLPDAKGDVWMFGMTAWELGTGEYPYYDIKDGALPMAIMAGELPRSPENPRFQAELDDLVLNVCHQCWNYPPVTRPNTDIIVNHLHNAIPTSTLAPPNSKDPRSRELMPLHWAAYKGDRTLFSFVLDTEQDVDINMVDTEGRSALHLAATGGHEDIARVLLDRNADVTMLDIHGGTPLHAAAGAGHKFIAEQLLKHDPKTVNAVDRNNRTPLYLSANGGHHEVAMLLLEHSADVNIADVDGCTALHWAVMLSQDNTTIALLDAGARTDGRDADGCTPLCRAARKGQSVMVKNLLRYNANATIADNERRSPLHWAARGCHHEIMKDLLQYPGVDLNALDAKGRTALFFSVAKGDVDGTDLLLQYGADPDASPTALY